MQRANNFDILRLLFACVVVLRHCSDLSLAPELAWIYRFVNSRIAVEGFFAMSGYLIVGSYERSSSLRSYFLKRALRILPAYWAALLFSLVIGLLVSTLSVRSFVGSSETWKYFASDLIFCGFLHPNLPGLFTNNSDGPAVNVALWTIKIELMFYLMVPAIVKLVRSYGPWLTLVPLFMASILYRTTCERLTQTSLAKQLPGQFCFFAIGILVYYSSSYFMSHKTIMWIVAFGSCLTHFIVGGPATEAAAVGLTVLCVALIFPNIQGPTKYGDFSYGAYVFHCPVIQVIVATGFFNIHPFFSVIAVVSCVGLLTVASWKFIESPALQIGRETSRLAIVASVRKPRIVHVLR